MESESKVLFLLISAICFIYLVSIPSVYAMAKIEGLVLYLSFDVDDKVIEDLSGNGHDGENHGAKSVEGKYGNALEFNGVTTWVTVEDAPDLNFAKGESLTAMCWGKILGAPSGQGNLLAKYAVGAGTTPFYGMFHNANNKLHAYIRDNNSTLVEPWSKDIINDDNWHHFALVRDAGKKVFLYVDGKLDFEGGDTTGDLTNNVPLAIGRHTGEWLVGDVDEAMVFRRALSENEINQAMDPKNLMAVSSSGKLATKWGNLKK